MAERKWGESRPGESYIQIEGPGNPSWERRNSQASPRPDNLSRIPSPPPRGRGGRDRGGYNEGAAWNRRPARREMDIVDKELNRYQPAFDHVQRYPEGYGGQPTRRGGGGFGGRRGGRGGGWDDNKFDRFIGAIEGLTGKGGGNITNTFNPTFNPVNVNAGRDIRDTSVIGGGPNTAGRDISGAGGDIETGDGGGGNTVETGPNVTVDVDDFVGNVDPGVTDPGVTDPGVTDPGVTDPGVPEATQAAQDWVETNVYGGLLNRSSSQDGNADGLNYWVNQYLTEGGPGNILDDVKSGAEFQNRETAKSLASSMEGKDYIEDDASSLGNINEASLDAWVGPGGKLTQSTDATANNYYEGVGSLDDYVDPDTGGAADQSTSDLFNLYSTKFNRNPDEGGLEYWEDELTRRTTGDNAESYDDVLTNIGESFDLSVEDTLRNNVNEGGYVTVPEPEDVPPTPSYGGGTEAQNFITDQTAYDTEQADRAENITHSTTSNVANTSSAVDDWLTNIYKEAGINQGKVDQGGRDYWTEQLQGKTQEQVKKDILWAAANN